MNIFDLCSFFHVTLICNIDVIVFDYDVFESHHANSCFKKMISPNIKALKRIKIFFASSLYNSLYNSASFCWLVTSLRVYTQRMFFFSRVLRDSTPCFVGPSVRRSVRRSHFTFFGFWGFLASPLLPNYGPCPPTRDWGSRVSGLVKPPGGCMGP